jgi:hypothetical protein
MSSLVGYVCDESAIGPLNVTKAYSTYGGANIQIHELTEAWHEQPAHRD